MVTSGLISQAEFSELNARTSQHKALTQESTYNLSVPMDSAGLNVLWRSIDELEKLLFQLKQSHPPGDGTFPAHGMASAIARVKTIRATACLYYPPG